MMKSQKAYMWRLLELRVNLRILVAASVVILLAACASGPRVANHSFEFDARWDSPGIEILDYRYGTSNIPGVRGCPKQYSPCPTSRQSAGTSGEMVVGDELYVKWRIKSTGEVYEDLVDLRSRLPENMQNQSIRFIVSGPQLFVFVISPEKLTPNPCPPRDQLCRITDPSCPSAYDRVFAMYCYKKFTQIYPN